MKISVMLIGVLFFLVGLVFSVTIIGAVVGVPLMIIGAAVFILGLILPLRL